MLAVLSFIVNESLQPENDKSRFARTRAIPFPHLNFFFADIVKNSTPSLIVLLFIDKTVKELYEHAHQ